MNDVLNRYDKMARLDRSVTGNSPTGNRMTPFAIATLFLVGITLGMIILATAKSCERDAQPVAVKIASTP